MKTILLTIFLSVVLSSATSAFSVAPITENKTETGVTTVQKKNKVSSFKHFRKETEKKIGRKLGLFERIGLWYYTKFTPETETDQKKANNHALLGFIFGVCSLVIFPLFAIPGFILSKNAMNKEKLSPGILEDGNKGLAKAGFILSIIGFASLLVFVIYIIVLLGGYGFGY